MVPVSSPKMGTPDAHFHVNLHTVPIFYSGEYAHVEMPIFMVNIGIST